MLCLCCEDVSVLSNTFPYLEKIKKHYFLELRRSYYTQMWKYILNFEIDAAFHECNLFPYLNSNFMTIINLEDVYYLKAESPINQLY